MLTPSISAMETKKLVEEKRREICINLEKKTEYNPHSFTILLL